MTRIDTPIAPPTADKTTDKASGKTTPRDGDGRPTAFRSLLRQLGGHDDSSRESKGKEARGLSDGIAARDSHSSRHRLDDKTDTSPDAETDTASPTTEPTILREPASAWDAILGGNVGDRAAQSDAPMDLTTLVLPRAATVDVPTLPETTGQVAANRSTKSPGIVLPATPDLDLAVGDTTQSAATDPADPFAALASLLDRSTDASPDAEVADIAPIKMSVVARETHFEPVARLSPVQQIATAIGEELVAAGEPASKESSSLPAEPPRHSSGPLKVLHVKLEPEDLGAVVLKMRLVDKSLELEVVASCQETADLLAKDRDMLTRALRGSGYAADVVAITTSVAPDNSQMAGDNRAGSQTSSGQAGAQAGGNRDANTASGGDDRQAARPQPMEGAVHEESGTGHSGGDLYL